MPTPPDETHTPVTSESIVPPPPADAIAQMRRGHVQIEESDQMVMALLREHQQRKGRSLDVLEMGAGSGFFTHRLSREVPGLSLTAQEDYEPVLEGVRSRLAGTPVELFSKPFRSWTRPVDVIISKGSLHHTDRKDLAHVSQVLANGGIFIVCDEFCPEFLTGAWRDRIDQAEQIIFSGGWVLTSEAEARAFHADNLVPKIAVDMERARQRALWTWYRYVIDEAIKRDCWETAVYELGAARDDLVTSAAQERKQPPSIAVKELSLLGYECLSSHCVDSEVDPEYQSFHIFVLAPSAAADK